jgi:ribonuclease HI
MGRRNIPSKGEAELGEKRGMLFTKPLDQIPMTNSTRGMKGDDIVVPPSPSPALPQIQVVGGCLQDFWPQWESIGASSFVVNLIRHGVTLEFSEQPPLSNVPIIMESYLHNTDKRLALRVAVEELIEKGVLEEVRNPNTPGYYGRLFIRPKPPDPITGLERWRSIIDLSELNPYIVNPSFQMETPKSIQQALRPGMWCTSVDLTDAYFQVPIHPTYRKYMRVALEGRVLQFKALPMGLNVSARLFTKIILELMRYLRSKGIHIHAYLDDWLIKNRDPVVLDHQTQYVVKLCQYLGLRVNLKKSELIPSQHTKYVGIQYNLVDGLALAPLDRIQDIEKLILSILSDGGASARKWACLIWKLGSVMGQIVRGPLHRRPVQWLLQSKWDQKKGSWEEFVEMEYETVRHLRWWCQRENTQRGVSLVPFQPDLTLYTDASLWGYGATLERREMWGQWSPMEKRLHSNNREMLATIKAVQSFSPLLKGKSVLICTDNTTTIATINKQGGTRSWSLTEMAWKLWSLLDRLDCTVMARHIPGKLNVRADSLSRKNQVISTEWSILPDSLLPIWDLWGRPEIDLFATCQNKKLRKYVSPVPDPYAWRINAMTFCWESLSLYAFPPWAMIGEVLMKVEHDQAELILIAPKWETRPWFPLLMELTVTAPVCLTKFHNLLVQSHSGVKCKDLEMFNLHAWKLSGKAPIVKALAPE